MTKRQAYFVIFVLTAAVVYLLFRPTKSLSPEPTRRVNDESVPAAVVPAAVQSDTETVETAQVSAEPVVVEGVFTGLTEDTSTAFNETFEYLLLDDGTEIIRIDLRPLIGYDKVDVPAKLGVTRGDRVRIVGSVAAGVFTISSIETIE